MSDIFREIEQEVRREQALRLWSKYQVPIFILAALIVAATGAWRYWQDRQLRQAEAAGARYESAVQLARDGKAADAQRAFEAIAKTPGGYGLLARFQAADANAEKAPSEAVKAYEALAGDPRTPPLLKDMARLRAALLLVDQPDPKDAIRRLQGMAGPGEPFHASAREQLAILALKQKDYAAAGRWLDMLATDPLAPAGVRTRAESLMGLVASAGPPPKAGAVAKPSAPAPSTAAPSTPAPSTPNPSASQPSSPEPSANHPASAPAPATAGAGRTPAPAPPAPASAGPQH